MEEQNAGVEAVNGNYNYLWWAGASTVQLSWGIYTVRRGFAGDGRLLPLKAFGIGTLFVSAFATTAIGTLSACGIHSVKDMMETCAYIRGGGGLEERLVVPPRARDE